MDVIEINAERLWSRHMELAKIGATEKGGNNRQALTDEDVEARKQFIAWCEAAGCTVRLDEIGNIFARREGRIKDAPPVITGSHLDTQPTGGRFDGIFGVLAGLEAIETLNDQAVETDHPIEVVVWCNEEGCRFTTAMMGSAVWSGNMPIEAAMSLEDTEGHTVRSELKRTGHYGSHAAKAFPVKAAIEAHIEQGPMLEKTENVIGVVTGVQNMSRHEIIIEGQEVHAGPTPMVMRQDPMRALAQFLPQLYSIADKYGEDARMTFGVIHADPASNNTVPGRLKMTVDIRHPILNTYEKMVSETYELVETACQREGAPVTIREFFHAPGVEFNPDLVDVIDTVTKSFNFKHMKMVSGAGHDACNIASVAPTTLIFIPCEGGISHNEAEYAEPEHIAAGANVLLNAMVQCAAQTKTFD